MAMPYPPMRKVLIINDVPSVRNSFLTLLADLSCAADVADSGRQVIDKIRDEKFDAVLLHLRYVPAPAEEVGPRIRSLQPSLLANVLVVAADVADVKTLDLIEWYVRLQAPGKRPVQDLEAIRQALRAMLRLPPVMDTP